MISFENKKFHINHFVDEHRKYLTMFDYNQIY